jgi:hypothetical protein
MKHIMFLVLCLACLNTYCDEDFLLMKSSPFYEYDRGKAADLDADRINFWPLFYKRGSDMSLLWPMVAASDDGNAVYPFYSYYYSNEFTVLWPMSSFSLTEDGGNRIFNTYWKDEQLTIFPFFFKDDDYWLAMFLAGVGTNEWYSIMPPMWIHWYGENAWLFLPGLTYMKRENTNYTFTTFPLYHQSRDDDEFLQWAACALYLHYHDRENSYTHLFPMLFSYTRHDTNTPIVLRGALPVFWHFREGTERVTLTPLFGTMHGTNTSGYITPLVSAGHMDNTKFFNLLGILFHRHWNPVRSEQYTHILFPLFGHYQSKRRTETNILWPLVSYNRYKTEWYKFKLFPLCSYSRHKLIPVEKYRHDFSRYPHIEKDLWILPWIKNKSGVKYTEDEAVPIPQQIMGKNQRINYQQVNENTNIWKMFAGQRYVPHDYYLNSFWPLWKYEHAEGADMEFYILKWLYSYNWDHLQDNTKSRILWRFLTYDRIGKDYSIDVFPFITYDKKPDDDFSQFSVFWKVYRYEKDKNRRKLNLFFIPFSWGGTGEE